jgi:hypothetical protein
VQLDRALAGPPTRSLDRRDRIDDSFQQHRVVGVGGRQAGSQGDAMAVDQQMVLGAEARLAVVAQVLTYAAYLHGLERADLERTILSGHLQRRGYDSLASAVAGDDQERSLDTDTFDHGLAESLSEGRFRTVIVLDAAPPSSCGWSATWKLLPTSS